MYAYFKGKLAYVGEDSIILDVHYNVQIKYFNPNTQSIS